MVDSTGHYTGHSISESKEKGAFGASAAEGIVGLGAVVLTIIGLAGVYPGLLVSIAVIAIGVALAFEGGSIAARYSALIGEENTKKNTPARWGGVSTLFLAGAAGIALGILSLINVVPSILVPVSAIVFGAALVLDSGANERLSTLEARHSEEFSGSESVVKETAQGAAGIQVLVGVGSIALGILALLGISTTILSLVAMLSIGTANLLTSSIVGGRIAKIFS